MAFYQRELIRRCGRDVSTENRKIREDKRRARSSGCNRTFNPEHLIPRRYVRVARFRNLSATSENCLRFLVSDSTRNVPLKKIVESLYKKNLISVCTKREGSNRS